MDMRNWFLAFHMLGVIVYAGSLLTLSRLLAFTVAQPAETRERLIPFVRRSYFFVTLPSLIVLLIFGLLLIFKVGEPGGGILDYLKPYADEAHTIRTPWYSTFHAKLVLFASLVAIDISMGRSIGKLSRGVTTLSPRRFKMLHGLMALIILLIVILMEAGPLKGPTIDAYFPKHHAAQTAQQPGQP
ncbi:MAG: CopD family protein [Planctomycetaceae bacterium]|nr:CopD family protein [Planctomycetaceae bacterium]